MAILRQSDAGTYLKLSSFYFFYFALLGGMAPYLGLYFEHLGFTALELAQLTSILMVTKVFAPNVWGWLGDHYGHRLQLIRYGSFATLLIFSGFFFAESFWFYAWIIAGYSFFWNAVLPQFEVITLHTLGAKRDRYSRIRLWGSIGFILAVMAIGVVIEQSGVNWLPAILFGIIASIWLSAQWRFREPPHRVPGHIQHFFDRLRKPEVWSFYSICFLLQVSHGAYYTFFSIYLVRIGYSETFIGGMWALGVAAEVLLFWWMHHLLNRYGLRRILLVALILTTLRWALIGEAADVLLALLFAQILHAASFGASHAVSIEFVHRYFAGEREGQAQALYSAASFGAGGAVGALLAGFVVTWTDHSLAFAVSSVICFASVILCLLFFKPGSAH